MTWRGLGLLLASCFLLTLAFAESTAINLEPLEEVSALSMEKPSRPVWVIVTLGLLTIMTAAIHAGFPNMILGESHFNSWPALLLFVTLGFSTGMLLFLAFPSWHEGTLIDIGPRGTFVLISLAFMALYILKITSLYFISHLFGVLRYFKAYIALLNTTYIYFSILALLAAWAISLVSQQDARWWALAAMGIAIAIFLYKLLKIVLNTIQTYRFPVFYLFVYLCTLEIAPMFILIKIVV